MAFSSFLFSFLNSLVPFSTSWLIFVEKGKKYVCTKNLVTILVLTLVHKIDTKSITVPRTRVLRNLPGNGSIFCTCTNFVFCTNFKMYQISRKWTKRTKSSRYGFSHGVALLHLVRPYLASLSTLSVLSIPFTFILFHVDFTFELKTRLIHVRIICFDNNTI